jgi:hypothetical protein
LQDILVGNEKCTLSKILRFLANSIKHAIAKNYPRRQQELKVFHLSFTCNWYVLLAADSNIRMSVYSYCQQPHGSHQDSFSLDNHKR